MSQENVKAVEAAFDAFEHGGLDAFAEHWTEDVDYRAVETDGAARAAALIAELL